MKIYFCIPFLYLTFILEVFFLPYVLNNNPHITYRSCEIKATLIVGREVIKVGFVNLCTSFCSFNSLSVSLSLILKTSQLICSANQLTGFYMRTILAFNELSLSRDNIWILMTRWLNNIWVLIIPETLKYQFGTWQGAVSISWAGELLFSLGWQSPTRGASIKILDLIIIPSGIRKGIWS